MKARHRAAIELLLCHPDTVVAEMLGVRLSTLRAWMQMDDFREALQAREREQQAGARRIARQAVVNSATKLCQIASDPAKPDAKLLLDVLKVSGAFDQQAQDPGAALLEAVRASRKNAEKADVESE